MPARRPPPAPRQDSPELRAPEYSLRQLSYFVAVAHHQSVHKAAEALHVSAPAVSAAVAHLENSLGVQLFLRRHARGLLLTEAGSALAIECQNLLRDAWELGSADTGGRAVQGRIHFGCLFTFSAFIIPELMRHFQEELPRARLFWHEGHHEYLIEGLQTGALDLALMYDFDVPSGIERTALRPAPLQAVLPADHRLARHKRLTLADLATEPFILLDLPRTREYLLSAFSADGIAPHVAHRVASIAMLQGLVASGHGFSLLNFCPPHAYASMGRVVSRPLTGNMRHPDIVIAHSHRYRLSLTAAALVERVAGLVDQLELSAA